MILSPLYLLKNNKTNEKNGNEKNERNFANRKQFDPPNIFTYILFKSPVSCSLINICTTKGDLNNKVLEPSQVYFTSRLAQTEKKIVLVPTNDDSVIEDISR